MEDLELKVPPDVVALVAAALSYVAYMDRFQIAPEERVLRARFGGAYEDYKHRVRRWA